MKKSPKLAFSLIELSVVILIIGILVLGVTQGKRIAREAKLKSARSLTASSPVNAFNDIALWLDATSEKSFDTAEASDQSSVSNWYDIKQSAATNAFNVSQSDSAKRPKYIANATNGLPALRFDGTDDFMQKTNVSGSALSDGGNQISIFIVQKLNVKNQVASIVWESAADSNRIVIAPCWNNGTIYFDFADIANGGRTTYSTTALEGQNYLKKTVIFTAVKRLNNLGLIRINGVTKNQSAMTGILNTSGIATFAVANSSLNGFYQNSDINEIIIIKSGLTDTEIASVEQYLSTKWGVPLTGI